MADGLKRGFLSNDKNKTLKKIKYDKQNKIEPIRLNKITEINNMLVNTLNYNLVSIWNNDYLKNLTRTFPIELIGYINKLFKKKYIIMSIYIYDSGLNIGVKKKIYCNYKLFDDYLKINNIKLELNQICNILVECYSTVNKFNILKICNIKNNKVDLDESEYTDIITGNFLEDPVFIEAEGEVYKTPVNRSTTKKLKECPFTRKKITNIINADDIKKKIDIWKSQFPDKFKIFMKNQNKIIETEKNQIKEIEDKLRIEIKEIVNSFKRNNHKNKEVWYLQNEKTNNGLPYRETEILCKLFIKESFKLEDDIYLYYNIGYKEIDDDTGSTSILKDTITFFKQCRCSSCRMKNFFINTISNALSNN